MYGRIKITILGKISWSNNLLAHYFWPMMSLLLVLVSHTFSLHSAAQEESQTPTPQPPPPPCQADVYRQFDFWLGDWEVFTSDGAKAGENKITREENGCLILEKWTSVTGGTGQSYNYVDASTIAGNTPQWRQIWVSGAATIDYIGGLNKDSTMVLKGTIAYRNGNTAPFRGKWSQQKDGSVKQFFEQFNTQTKEWDSWFLGIYRRKKQNKN